MEHIIRLTTHIYFRFIKDMKTELHVYDHYWSINQDHEDVVQCFIDCGEGPSSILEWFFNKLEEC